jgi:hypothetical protein
MVRDMRLTLGTANHSLEDQTHLPDPSLGNAVVCSGSTGFSHAVRVVVIVEVKVFSHSDKTNSGHPGTPEVSSLRGCLPGLQQEDHRLHGTETRNVFEALLVFYIGC